MIKNTKVGAKPPSAGDFPSQGWNPGLPTLQAGSHHLSHQGSHINPMPSLTKAHFFSFSTTTTWGASLHSVSHLHSAQLHTSPLSYSQHSRSIWATSDFPVGMFSGHFPEALLLWSNAVQISCITPSFVKSSFLFTYHPNRPPTPLSLTPHP